MQANQTTPHCMQLYSLRLCCIGRNAGLSQCRQAIMPSVRLAPCTKFQIVLFLTMYTGSNHPVMKCFVFIIKGVWEQASRKKIEMLPFVSPCTSWFLCSTLWWNGWHHTPMSEKYFKIFSVFMHLCNHGYVNIGYFKATKIIMKF